MAAAQHLWAPIPTTLTSITPVSEESVAQDISNFLQLHHGELPGDSNATASLLRLIQGLRDPAVEAHFEAKAYSKQDKKRKHDKSESDDARQVAINGDTTTSISIIDGSAGPAKKKKKKKDRRLKEEVVE